MKLLLVFILCLVSCFGKCAERGELFNYVYLFENGISASIIDAYLTAAGMTAITPVRYDVAVCRVQYWTLDSISQNVVVASGALQVPMQDGQMLDSPMPLVVFSHGTQSYRWYVPSCPHNSPNGPYSPYLPLNLETLQAFVYSSSGYCVFSPDYAGLGFDTNSAITPYLIADREPIAVIDGIRAVTNLAAQINLKLNRCLFLAGYSQGGHVCLATHRMIEAEYADEFRVTAAAPGGSPADLSGTIADLLKSGQSGGTSFISFTVSAYQLRYRLWQDFSEVFLSAYTNVPDLFYGATKTMSYISSQLPSNSRDLLTASVISQATNSSHLFAKTIASNNVYQWRPNCPITLFYAGSDTTVPPANSITACNAMRALGADANMVNVGETLDHSTGFGETQILTLRYFDQYRYTMSAVGAADFDGDGKADPCVYDSYGGMWRAKLSSWNYNEAAISGFGDNRYSPLAADYDGDRKTDLILTDGIKGTWQIRLSASSYLSVSITNFGSSNWPALTPDFDGDGLADPTYYVRGSNAVWIVRLSTANYAVSNLWLGFGGATYVPMAADYDGDRKADPVIYETLTGEWNAKLSHNGYQNVGITAFGGVGYNALVADFDGDAKTDPAVYDYTLGKWYIYLSAQGYILATLDDFGGAGYTAFAADFDGDAKADPAIWQASTGILAVKLSASGYATTLFAF